MRGIAFKLLLVAIVIWVGAPSWAATCGVEGGYGYAYSGLLQIGKGPSMSNFEPTATSGRIEFAANGTLSGKQIDNSGGVVFSRDITGSYEIVAGTCTGTMTRKFEVNGVTVFTVEESITVVNGGSEIKFIRTNPPFFMVQGSMTKQ